MSRYGTRYAGASSGTGAGADISGTAAGGDLTGTYPNPSIAAETVGDAHIDPADPLGRDKLAAPEAFTAFNASGGAAPALTAGWAAVSPYTPGFWLDEATGLVHLEGVLNFSADPPAASIMFTMPAGYRPVRRAIQPVQVIHNSVATIALFNCLETTGDCWVGGNFNTNTFVYMSGVYWRVDA